MPHIILSDTTASVSELKRTRWRLLAQGMGFRSQS